MTPITDSQRSAAKVAAVAFLVSMAFIAYGNFGLRGELFVDGDISETVRRIASSEPTYRLAVVFDLVYATGMIVLLGALYVVLGPVNRYLALLASCSKLVYAVSAVLMALSSLTILRLASEPAYLHGLGPDALNALVALEWSGTWAQYYVGLVFWALSSTLFAWLWLESRYVPRALAVFGVVASAWCLFCAVAYILSPGFSDVVNVWLFDMPMGLFYMALSLWLLIKGLRDAPDRTAA